MKETNKDLALNGNEQPEVADIFRLYGENYRQYNPLSYGQRKAMHHIEICRTAELGGHVEQCDQCGYERIAYNSNARLWPRNSGSMTERASCFPAVIFILFSPYHITSTLLYYAIKKSPCKFYLPLSVKPYRHLLKIPNGDLKVDSDSFPFCIHGLRLLWTIFIFTA